MDTKTVITIVAIFGLAMGLVIVGAFFTEAPDFEVRRLLFAAGVLAVLAFLLVFGIAAHVAVPAGQTVPTEAGKAVFDSLIKVIPPIITLVLGFYFGQTSTDPRRSDESATQSVTKGEPGKGTKSVSGGATSNSSPRAPEGQSAGKAPPSKSAAAVGRSETGSKTAEEQVKGPENAPGK